MKALEIDKKFDDNQEDILDYFDTSKVKMINEEPKRVKSFIYKLFTLNIFKVFN